MVAKEPEEASSGPRDNKLFRINGHLTLSLHRTGAVDPFLLNEQDGFPVIKELNIL